MTKKTKHWWHSKTIWLNIIATCIGIFAFLETQYPGIAILTTVTGILNIILRTVTTSTIIGGPTEPTE